MAIEHVIRQHGGGTHQQMIGLLVDSDHGQVQVQQPPGDGHAYSSVSARDKRHFAFPPVHVGGAHDERIVYCGALT
jgi:hypothetical protein